MPTRLQHLAKHRTHIEKFDSNNESNPLNIRGKAYVVLNQGFLTQAHVDLSATFSPIVTPQDE
ncbi:uncharacterized protein MELLADRAFT_94531 [Melampsora larici-populina 98AG31]|uniref:Uncharacterized protein n=1 Tax=Melampsora larici-populina (strain 98AG31 / pathotype 3-4-7) TaxID=747676 RepID=F4RBR5_MELLP|nr:uncharacterized protein MELLADRAFT_94531 [Melampsora larici-populina 98AG31]EGG10292.1 hypothetical protein MELLADRAFT_94531 [Melampsora larici-populina 98AG31]